ncbi:hypothetical protein Q427_18390 [Halomonas sp. BC04]|nr:hypothetical protein Q427_18390 [Halomonas sp. BC04]
MIHPAAQRQRQALVDQALPEVLVELDRPGTSAGSHDT